MYGKGMRGKSKHKQIHIMQFVSLLFDKSKWKQQLKHLYCALRRGWSIRPNIIISTRRDSLNCRVLSCN